MEPPDVVIDNVVDFVPFDNGVNRTENPAEELAPTDVGIGDNNLKWLTSPPDNDAEDIVTILPVVLYRSTL
jgi:hypothetical protein